jgi:hypothetical protein
MRFFSDARNWLYLSTRSQGIAGRSMSLLTLCVATLIVSGSAVAQSGSWTSTVSSLCSRENALGIIRQQIDATRAFDDPVQRIAVLIRAADLLWPYQQDKARTAFTEAFELAAQDFKERGDQPKREGRALLVQTADQRYVVIRAVAKRDPVWAKKLTDGILKKNLPEAMEAVAKNPESDVRMAWKLLDSATALLPSDQGTAINFARASLIYPASVRLSTFLYKLAESDQRAADQFYEQALAVYSDKPAREFLYLTAYPFGFGDSGDMPWSSSYTVPANFVSNRSLQRLFVQTLLRRASQVQQIPLSEDDSYNGFPSAGHILQVVARVEPQVKQFMPDLVGELEQTRSNLLGALSPENQEIFLSPSHSDGAATGKTFDEQVEAAKAETNANRRDELLVTAILNAGPAESLERVVSAIGEIEGSNARSQLQDWVYFSRTQDAIKDKRIDEARKLATKVQEIDQRAYLYSEIAKESLQTIENQNQTRELLDDVVATATKGPNTLTAARALLSAAYSYLKIDPGRALTILGDAIKSINRLESPDFSRQSLVRKIEGNNFAHYAIFKTPGFDPENAFREMAKIDFDIALSQASSFTDKHLRSLTTLALADFCLQHAEQQQKAEKTKKTGTP